MKAKRIVKRIIGILLVVFIASAINAANSPEKSCAEKMHKKLSEQIKYPGYAVKRALQGQVTMIFTVSEKGFLQIKNVTTDEPELAEFVKKELANMHCEEMIKVSGQDFKVRFHFRLL